jgi:hypothetical protein
VLVRSDPTVGQPDVIGVPDDLVNRIQTAVQAALASGMQNGFIGMLVASVIVASTLTFWFPDAKLRRTRSDHDMDW